MKPQIEQLETRECAGSLWAVNDQLWAAASVMGGMDMSRQLTMQGQSDNKKFSDTFTRADAGNLGANWTQVLGSFTITSNSAQGASATDLATVAGWSTPHVSEQVTVSQSLTTNAGLLARVQPDGSAYVLYVNALPFNNTSLILGTLAADGVTVTVLASAAISNTVAHTIKLDVKGSHLTGYVGGVATVTATDSTFTGTGGIGIWGTEGAPGGIQFTNFSASGARSLTLTGQV